MGLPSLSPLFPSVAWQKVPADFSTFNLFCSFAFSRFQLAAPLYLLLFYTLFSFYFYLLSQIYAQRSTMDGDVSAHSQEAEKETTRLWRTFRTVYEMLADRVSFFPIGPCRVGKKTILDWRPNPSYH